MIMEVMRIGVPVTEQREGESYNEGLKVHIVGPDTNDMKFEYLRFEEDSPMHKDIINNIHIAYKVDSMQEYLDKYEILHPVSKLSDELSIAFINMDGVVVELMEFHK